MLPVQFITRKSVKSAGVAVALTAILTVSTQAHGPAAKTGATGKDPLTVVVSLSGQRLEVYRGAELLQSAPVSTGRKGHATPAGIFSILQKRRWHESNIYSRAPMPFMQRLTWSGIALHVGHLPGYPASHGCIRLPNRFGQNLFRMTRMGSHVVVVRERAAPAIIEHPALFQPTPPVALVSNELRGTTHEASKTDRQTKVAQVTEARVMAMASLSVDEGHASDAVEAIEPTETERKLARLRAYEERPRTPLRILITRRTGRERTADLQRLLKKLGYDPGEVDGLMGPATAAAIKGFQTDAGWPVTGAFSDELFRMLHRAAGLGEPASAHIYVRQDFEPLFDAPMEVRDPGRPLGTHLFTAMHFGDGEQETRWVVLSADGSDAGTARQALERIELPGEIRRRISERLTPGSSLIVSDDGISEETTPKGTDFIALVD